MFVVVEGYSTSQFSGECLFLLRVQEKQKGIVTLNSISATGLHDRHEEIASRGHLVYRQKASTDARGNACELGAI